jgi:beta-mannosidase
VRFVSEFGAQAVPEELDISAVPWPPDSTGLLALADAGLHVDVADAQLPFASQTSAESWAEASRHYQVAVVKHCIETLRRLKYRPTGGFAQYMFHDVQPGISAAVLDDERRPKPAWEALREACRPVIVVADPLPASIEPGADLHLAVHAVSDLRKPLANVEVAATLRWRQERLEWRFGGEIEADSVVRVGTARFAAPTVPGPLRLDLTLTADGVTASNSYAGRVVS